MRLITGDECGLLKECIPELSRKNEEENQDTPIKPYNAMPDVVTKEGVNRIDPKELQQRSRGVIDMVFTNDDDENKSFAALRQHGSVEFWEGSTNGQKKSFGTYDLKYSTKNLFDGLNDDKVGEKIRPLGLGSFSKLHRLVGGDCFGNLAVLNVANGKIVERFNGYSASKKGHTISYTPGNNLNLQLATAMGCDPIHGRVAIGGRERETMLLDLASGGKVVFKAKNLPPDPQTLLQQPVWPTAIEFLSSSDVMAVGTAYKQVRLYDVRENSKMRRPTATTPEGLLEYRVTSLCQVDEYELVVGDAAGYIYSLDIRTLGRNPKSPANKNMARYVGPAGSVRKLIKHPTLPRLAAVGLDRMLRIYDIDKRKQLNCVYLKQRLNCILFAQDGTWDTSKSYKGDGSESDGDKDDSDIDQDDVVRDYVDSDEDSAGIASDNADEMSAGHNSSEQEEQSSSDGDEEDYLDDQDHSVKEEDSTDESSEDQGSSSDVLEGKEEIEASNSDSDEEVIIKAPKKRRHR